MMFWSTIGIVLGGYCTYYFSFINKDIYGLILAIFFLLYGIYNFPVSDGGIVGNCPMVLGDEIIEYFQNRKGE